MWRALSEQHEFISTHPEKSAQLQAELKQRLKTQQVRMPVAVNVDSSVETKN